MGSVQIAPLRKGKGCDFDRLLPRRYQPAFTLLELLVVVVIIGLLASYVGPKYFSQIGKSEVTVARSQIEAFERALDSFRLDVGRYPTSEEGLDALLHRPSNATGWNILL